MARQDPTAAPLRQALRPRGPIRFEITETQMADAVCLEIEGEVDALTVPKLAAELSTVVRRSEKDIVVDLRKANFIDSAGLQILLATQRRLNTASRKLTVICNAGPVKRVIEVARLDEILGLHAGDDV